MTSVINDTTLGPNTGDAVAYTGHTLATASCQVDFGEYTSLLNVAMHDSVEVEAVLKIETDLKSLATVFAQADESTYYKFVHRDEAFGTDFGDDAEGLKTHNEELSVAYAGGLGTAAESDYQTKFFSMFRRRMMGLNVGELSIGKESYASKIIEYIMARMFSPDVGDTGLPKAFLRTDIFSVDRVQETVLSQGKIDMLTGCAFRNWLDPSKINEDSEFITTHRSSQDNSVLGYSVNADGIQDLDVLVLNIKFQPDQIAGFESVDRTLRVEFIHRTIQEGLPTVQDGQWLFANQSVFTASGGASDEAVWDTHSVLSMLPGGPDSLISQFQLKDVPEDEYDQFTDKVLIIGYVRYDFDVAGTNGGTETGGIRLKDSTGASLAADSVVSVNTPVKFVDAGSSTHIVKVIQDDAAMHLIDLVGHDVYNSNGIVRPGGIEYSSFAGKRLFIAGEEWNFVPGGNGIFPRYPDGTPARGYDVGIIRGALISLID